MRHGTTPHAMRRHVRGICGAASLALSAGIGVPALALETITLGDPAGVTQGTFTIGAGGLFALSQLGTPGTSARNYVASFFSVGATQSYVFGQTSAPVDTVMILYDGVFDPAAPATRALQLNDDASASAHLAAGATVASCGSPAYCPQLTQSLTAGQLVTLVVTTYGAGTPLGLPLTYYSSGPGVFSSAPVTGGGDITTTRSVASLTGSERFDGGTLTLDADVAQAFPITANGGTLDTGGGSATVSGGFSDAPGASGALVVTGGGTVTLSGVNTHSGGTTVTGGTTLIVPAATALGAGGLALDNGTLAASQGLTVTQALTVANGATIATGNAPLALQGAIGGTGPLTIAGGNVVTLTGASGFAGSLSVSGGTTLIVGAGGAGSLAGCGALTVSDNATLGGTGTVCGATIQATGTLAPGNSIGTITVAGNLVLAPASTTAIEFARLAADRIEVTGTATLAGTLAVSCENGNCVGQTPFAFGTAHRIISAAGGVTGAFAAVTTAISGTRFDTLHSANAVDLVVTPALFADLSGESIALSLNQIAVARALDRARPAAGTRLTGGSATLFDALYRRSGAALGGAYTELSGEIHAALGPMAARSAGLAMRAGLDQPQQHRTEMAGHAALWVAPLGGRARIDGEAHRGAQTRSETTHGVAAGAEYRFDAPWTLGVALAGLDGRARLAQDLGSADTTEAHGVVYARGEAGGFLLGAALGYGLIDVSTRRRLALLGVDPARADYQAHAWSGRVEARHATGEIAGIAVAPFGALQATALRIPDVAERNGAARTAPELTFADRTEWTSVVDLGLRLSASLAREGQPIQLHGLLGWRHYLDRDAGLAASLSGIANSGFAVMAARPAADAALLGVGIAVALTDAVSLGAQLDSEISTRSTALAGGARLSVRF
jgi:fibronectin-binding autotransporter adhesin